MKKIILITAVLLLSACVATPYKSLNLDTTSNFKSPEKDKAGIVVYQWKRGIFGAAFDVDFIIKGLPEVSLNTGEYSYFEIAPGNYEYRFSGGLIDQYIPVTFEAGNIYFFRAFMLNLSDQAYLVREQDEINDAKKFINSGRYEHHTVD